MGRLGERGAVGPEECGGAFTEWQPEEEVTLTDPTTESQADELRIIRDLFNWFQGVAITSIVPAEVKYRRDIDIVLEDHASRSLLRWSHCSTWPVNYVAGDWDTKSDEEVIDVGDGDLRLL